MGTATVGKSLAAEWLLGVFFILTVAVLWAAASVLVQYIYQNLAFDRPFVLTYVCNTLFAVYIPIYMSFAAAGCVANPSLRDGGVKFANLQDSSPPESSASVSEDENPFSNHHQPSSVPPLDVTVVNGIESTAESLHQPTSPLISHQSTAWIALVMCPLWFAANYSYNASLKMTSVTSSTIIATSSSLFTLVFSVAFASEKFSLVKGAGVFFCMAGAIAVAIHDHTASGKASVWGDLVCLFSAAMYGVYTTVLRVQIPSDDAVAMPLMFGYLGTLSGLLLLPVLLGLLIFSPSVVAGLTGKVFGFIVLKGLFDNVLSDYLWARAVVLTTPTVATVGLSLTIPMAFLSDFVFHGALPGALAVVGALGVILGFLLVNVDGWPAVKAMCCSRGRTQTSSYAPLTNT